MEFQWTSGTKLGGNKPKIDSKNYKNLQAKKENQKQSTGGILSRLGRLFARQPSDV